MQNVGSTKYHVIVQPNIESWFKESTIWWKKCSPSLEERWWLELLRNHLLVKCWTTFFNGDGLQPLGVSKVLKKICHCRTNIEHPPSSSTRDLFPSQGKKKKVVFFITYGDKNFSLRKVRKKKKKSHNRKPSIFASRPKSCHADRLFTKEIYLSIYLQIQLSRRLFVMQAVKVRDRILCGGRRNIYWSGLWSRLPTLKRAGHRSRAA